MEENKNSYTYTEDDIEAIMELKNIGIDKIVVMYDLKVYTNDMEDVRKTIDVLQCICDKKEPECEYTTDKSYEETESAMVIELYQGIDKCVAVVYLNDSDGELRADPITKTFNSIHDLI